MATDIPSHPGKRAKRGNSWQDGGEGTLWQMYNNTVPQDQSQAQTSFEKILIRDNASMNAEAQRRFMNLQISERAEP